MRSPISLLPPAEGPRLRALPDAEFRRRVSSAGAVLLVQELDEPPAASLPFAAQWRALHGRAAPRAGDVRHISAGGGEPTLIVVWCRAQASTFERLAAAGKAMTFLASFGELPTSMALLAGTRSAPRRAALYDAAWAAAAARAFALPSARAPGGKGLRTVLVPRGAGLDVDRLQVTADATNLVRHLTALPPNVLDVAGYRRAIATLARRNGLRMRWIGQDALERAGAGAFLSVTRGSARRDGGIAHLSWRPRGRGAREPAVRAALVGKGIVFDTGGTNLKPHKSMLDMHTDMAGSAVALATLVALARLRAPFAADAWLAITDNAIGPDASRPQEVVRAANGVSIQIVHSDAEGRMVLADTLALASRTRPRTIVDFATLTGACVYALTERMSGVFSNRQSLLEALARAGTASGERVWPFPLDEDFDTDIESQVADVAQCAVEGKGDHILAARFLGRFVPRDQAWAHVDLSSATRRGGLGHVPTEITGFGVRLALRLLLDEPLDDA